jgi:Ca-activated chloride channel homolog
MSELFTINEPRALLMLLALGLVVAIGVLAVRARPRDRERIALSTVVRCAIIILVVLAVAGLQFVARGGALNVIYLIDESASVNATDRQAARNYVASAVAQKGREGAVGVVRFGEFAVVDRAASGETVWTPGDKVVSEVATDIAGAIQVALALFPEDGNRRLILLSDGQETGGDAAAAARRAGASGVEISVVPLGAAAENEAAIRDVSAPAEVPAGQQHDVRVVIQSTSSRQATVVLTDNGAPAGRQEVVLAAGQNVVTFSQKASEQGFHRFEATLETIDDHFSQNNTAAGYTVVKRPPQVLVVASEDSDAKPLLAALESTGVEAKQVSPDGMPRRLANLAEYDAVVLSNVSAERLGEDGQESLEAYVRELGHGLVMLGGDVSFGAGGYLRTTVERMLPVSMDVRATEQRGSLALAFVLDKSGSMGRCHCGGAQQFDPSMRTEYGFSKIELAKQAIGKAVDLLKPTDQVGVIGFDARAFWLSQLQPLGASGGAGLKQSLQPIQALGETNMYGGLQTAVDALKTSDAQLRHIVLIGDGWTQQGDFSLVLEQVEQNNISLTTVGAGDGPGALLRELADKGGGQYYRANDVKTLPDIILKETVRLVGSYYIEESTDPVAVRGHPIIRGLDAALPPLLGYNATTLKPSAELILAAPNGDPILAQWQYGLGRTVAWTSDAKGRWARDWVSWPDFGRFMGQAISWTFPRGASPGLALGYTVERGGEPGTRDLRIRLESTDADGLPRNGLESSLVITTGTGVRTTHAFEQISPGVYTARVSGLAKDTYEAQVTQVDPVSKLTVATQSTGLIVPYADEYLLQPDGAARAQALLTGIAEYGRGTILTMQDPGASLAPAQVEQPRRVPLWPWLLAAAVLLFPLDVALRRLNLGWRRGSKPEEGTTDLKKVA